MFYQSYSSTAGNSKGHYYIIGRVKSVVLGPYLNDQKDPNPDFQTYDDLGKITFEMLYSSLNVSVPNSISKPAYPMFSFFKQYPVIGEIVLIVSGPSHGLNDDFNNQSLYYYPPFNVWKNPNHNVFPNLSELSVFYKSMAQNRAYNGNTSASKIEYPKGYTFTESAEVKSIRPFEGDSIVEGRFGQSIRFGSTVSNFKSENYWSSYGNNGSPITIIVNGHGKSVNPDSFASIVENINNDDTSIYMTSGQSIMIEDLNNFSIASFGVGINTQVQTTLTVELPTVVNDTVDPTTQDQQSINA